MQYQYITENPEPTLFFVDIQKLINEAKEYSDNGASHLQHEYGRPIDTHLKNTHFPFYNHLSKNGKLIEYALFYCFKAGLYYQSYKHEMENLKSFQLNELVYFDIFEEIKIDSQNFHSNVQLGNIPQ